MPISVVEKKLRELPEEYLFLIANYIDSIKARIENNTPASGKGMAAAYANPSLIEKEKSAFAEAMVERYEKSLAETFAF